MPNSGEQPNGAAFFSGGPKMVFVFGLMAGVALTSVGYDLFSNPGSAAADTNKGAVAVKDTTGAAAAAGTTPKVLAEITDADHVRGNLEKAKVVLVEYSDYECPFCGRHHPTMQTLFEEYGDDVAWVYRHFPLSFHPQATPAALAAECAAEQDKFWEYTDALVENQDQLSDDYYSELAGELKMNVGKFEECYTSGKYASKVSADAASGRAAGVTGTPATFVNGQMISGAVDVATFRQLIDAELAK